MGRPRGSKNKTLRAKARSAYETYEYWYDKYTKGAKSGWFRDKYTKEEFEEQYQLAKQAKMTNPARMVAASQEYVDRKFEKKYKEMYGTQLGDIRDKETREALFTDFVDDLLMQGKTYDEARDEFERYFY